MFHQLDCNIQSTVDAAVALAHRYPEMLFLICDVINDKLQTPISSGFAGSALLIERLTSSGVEASRLVRVGFDYSHEPMIHTLSESELAISAALRQKWDRLLVVAPPFHLPRAAMTAASVSIKRNGPRILAHVGTPLQWEETSQHSQGMFGMRLDFLDSE